MTDIVLDICGTLADNSHRMHLCPKAIDPHALDALPDASWAAFMAPELVAKDRPLPPVWDAIYGLFFVPPSSRFLIITGRSEALMGVTLDWLHTCSGQYGGAMQRAIDKAPLCMRALDDRRPSSKVKRDWLHYARRNGYAPTIAFEDRASDARMYREEGLFVFQVAEGDF